MYFFSLLTTLLLFLTGIPAAHARAPAVSPSLAQTATLKNGMQVVVIPNHRVPAVSHMVWYRFGAADDPAGGSGLAHYLEHLMFKETETIAEGEFSKIIARLGGRDNAFTSWDFTAYFQQIAAEHLETVMRMEADRMRNLRISDTAFAKEKDVVKEERRLRVESSPERRLSEQLNAVLFGRHPYGAPVIGWMEDITAVTRQDVLDFYHARYHPANAILMVSGDATLDAVLPLAEKHYGAIPGGTPVVRRYPSVPAADATRREVTVRHPDVRQPHWMRAYLAPSHTGGETKHAYALEVLSHILGGSTTSRLYQELVVEKKLAASASVSYSALRRERTSFRLHVAPNEGVALPAIEAAVEATLTTLYDEGVTADELARAQTQLAAEAIYARDGLHGITYAYGMAMAAGLDAGFVDTWPDRIRAVTADDIKAAAAYLLQPERAVTGVLLSEDEEKNDGV